MGPGSDKSHVLVRDLKTPLGQDVSDHLWFPNTREWSMVKPGDAVSFDASAHAYMKGKKRNLDYGLNRPLNLKAVKSAYELYFEKTCRL